MPSLKIVGFEFFRRSIAIYKGFLLILTPLQTPCVGPLTPKCLWELLDIVNKGPKRFGATGSMPSLKI